MGKLILAVLSFPAVYAAFSFALWEVNPGAWSEDARSMLVMVAVSVFVAVLSCPYLPAQQQERDQ